MTQLVWICAGRREPYHPPRREYYDPALHQRVEFPSVFDVEPEVELSVVVPAYNEQERLHLFFDDALPVLEQSCEDDPSFSWEIIVVDDGSTDKQNDVAMRYVQQHGCQRVRLLALPHNRGKGGAVQEGFLCARGRYVLFADADGAAKFECFHRLRARADAIARSSDGAALALGSRAHLQKQAEVERTWFRNLCMHLFHLAVMSLCVQGVRDTQCGFKMLTRRAVQLVMLNQHMYRWSFDVDLLVVSNRFGVPIEEVGIAWTEIPGGKLNPIADGIRMAMELVQISASYALGVWRLVDYASFPRGVDPRFA